MPRKEHAGVNCKKTILQIIKEDRVIKMDKEPLRNKNTGKNFSYCFHFQMPKDTRYKKWAYHKTLRRVLLLSLLQRTISGAESQKFYRDIYFWNY